MGILPAVASFPSGLLAWGVPEVDWQLGRQVAGRLLAEIWQTQAHGLLLALVLWATVGALLGLGSALAAVLITRRLGEWNSGSRHARWVRWLGWSLMVASGAVLGGVSGGWHGLGQGAEVVLRRSQLATTAFPPVGGLLADGIGLLHLELAPTNAADPGASNRVARLDGFRTNAWELDAAEFQRRLGTLRGSVATNLTAQLQASLANRAPALASGLNHRIVTLVLQRFALALVEGKVESELRQAGILPIYHAVRDGLVAEARKRGDPKTIAHAELTEFLVQEAVVPTLLRPIQAFTRTNVRFFAATAALALALPPVGFRLTLGRSRPSPRHVSPASSPGDSRGG